MANARVRNPVGSALPISTSLTHPERGHLIMGPFTTGTALTLTCCMLVNVSEAGLLSKHVSKTKPAGAIIYDPTYNWGTTTPSMSATLPDYIEVYICVEGGCLIRMDVSKVIDAAYLGAPVYESDLVGACAIAASAAPTVIGEAAHVQIGILLDLVGGNTGTGTGGADGDLAEVLLGPSGPVSSA